MIKEKLSGMLLWILPFAVIVGFSMLKPVSAMAVDMDYVGEITPEMIKEEQNSGSSSSKNSSSNRITVTTGISYDTEEEYYVYSVDSGEIYCSAMDGMIIKGDVSFSTSSGVSCLIMKDGSSYTVSNDEIADKGKYTISISSGGVSTKVFSFTIVGSYIGTDITSYSLPSTFKATKATLDGSDILSDTKSIDMSEEGSYVIEYSSSTAGTSYKLAVTADHVAPTLELPGVVDGKIRGPLDISDYNSEDTITITRNGKTVSYSSTLTNCGKYVITLSDQAGNTSVYTVFVGFYFNVQTVSFLILFVLIILGMFIYIRISKKKFRVR